MLNFVKKVHTEFLNIEKEDRTLIIKVAFNMFLLLFSYPMIRSTSIAMFVEKFGAKSTPWIWFLSVVFLSIAVTLYNYFQKSKSIFKIYSTTAGVTVILFAVFIFMYKSGMSFVALPFNIWKEVYIVLLVHLTLGYLNTKVKYEVAKLTYGPLGALGSLGGVFGGIITSKLIPWGDSYFTKGDGLIITAFFGTLIILLSILLFRKTNSEFIVKEEKKSPVNEAWTEKKYVLIICSLVAISQFVINLSNFKFNLGLEKYIDGAGQKGAFLGTIYFYINLLSFTFQVLLIPIILKYVRVRVIHFSIPLIFLSLYFLTLGNFGGIFFLSILFVSYKGLDYSLFSTTKEMLYFPLTQVQKYGAKYLVDMIVYRSSKMLISLVLLAFNSAFFVDSLLGICLIIWIVLGSILMTNKSLIKSI